MFLEYLEKKHQSINDYIKYLSTTTDDFKNFFNPNKSKEKVYLTEPIENALIIVQSKIKNQNIEIVKNYQYDAELLLYKNEVTQVILNLLKNAEDNFLIKNIENPKITIKTQKKEEQLIIAICDNGGGISKENIDKIFNPYFSTKDNKNGTGLGLYISKIIIEKHNNGVLSITNTKDGACFEIAFKQ
jgi:C4-dicarboxylate-specific signal transduction histidine kinase